MLHVIDSSKHELLSKNKSCSSRATGPNFSRINYVSSITTLLNSNFQSLKYPADVDNKAHSLLLKLAVREYHIYHVKNYCSPILNLFTHKAKFVQLQKNWIIFPVSPTLIQIKRITSWNASFDLNCLPNCSNRICSKDYHFKIVILLWLMRFFHTCSENSLYPIYLKKISSRLRTLCGNNCLAFGSQGNPDSFHCKFIKRFRFKP